MTEYSKLTRGGQNWFSPPFYSGPRGYKICLCVWYNGPLMDMDLLSVCAHLMRGEYDDRLMWPFRGDITVQMVNQISDQNHLECTLKFTDKCSISSCSRVISGERAGSGSVQGDFALFDFENTMYITGDCVKFRVTKVSVTA